MFAPFAHSLTFLVLCLLVRKIESHAACVDPRNRGTIKTHSLSIPDLHAPGLPHDDCPHCLNGGGKDVVMKAANGIWRPYEPMNRNKPFRHDSGLCGDAIDDAAPRDHENGGKFGPPSSLPTVKTYKSGQVIEFTVDVTTNHNGFFEFFICDATKCGGDISESCFVKGHCAQLFRVSTPACESGNSVECGPIDPSYPGRWYVPCRKGDHVGEHFMGGEYMRYALPSGIYSSHAVIQWYWAAANSCNPPGFMEYFETVKMPGWGTCPGDGGAQGGRNPTLKTCGGSLFPEEFWTCADVEILPEDNTSLSTPTTTPNPKQEQDDIEEKESGEDANESKEAQNNENSKNNDDDDDRKRYAYEGHNSKTKSKGYEENFQYTFSTDNVGKDTTKTGVLQDLHLKSDKKRCVVNWHQCGGSYYKGESSCCSKNFNCISVNQYYSQCMLT